MDFIKILKQYTTRFLKDMQKYFYYAVCSAKADLKSEVSNSYLDWLWWLIEPFCMMLVYAVIFGIVFNASEPYWPIFIYIGITAWGFFSRSVSNSVSIIRKNKGIISKVYIPKYILLFSKMLVNAFKMLVSMGLIFVMMFIFKVPLTIYIFGIIPELVVLFLFTFGIGTILMNYGVYIDDLGYVADIVLKMLMYLTGVFYNIAKRVPAPYGNIIEKLNPLAFIISGLRKSLLYGENINIGLIIFWVIISVIIAALGIVIIYHNENSYVKVI